MPPVIYSSQASSSSSTYVVKVTRPGVEPDVFPDVEQIITPAHNLKPGLLTWRAGRLWFTNVDAAFTISVRRMDGVGGDSLPATSMGIAPGTVAQGFDVDEAGRYAYINDGRIISKMDLNTGTSVTLAGSSSQGYVDAVGTAARFRSSGGLAIGPDGFLYVADTGNDAIRKVDVDSGSVTTFHLGITSISVFWMNGNLYRDDLNNGLVVHYADDLDNPVLRNHQGIGGASSINMVASSAGVVYLGNNASLVAAETGTLEFHNTDGRVGRTKSYASHLASPLITTAGSGKSYNRFFQPLGSLAIADDGEDELFRESQGTSRGAAETVDSAVRVRPVKVAVVRSGQVDPVLTAEHPVFGDAIVETMSGSGLTKAQADTQGIAYDGVYDPETQLGGVYDLISDIEYDGSVVWVADETLGLRSLTTSEPFTVTTVRPDLVRLHLTVDSGGVLYALVFRNSTTGAVPCPLYQVGAGGATALINTVPGAMAPQANGFVYQEGADVWWAWQYRENTFVNSGPSWTASPVRLVQIPRSGTPTVHDVTILGGASDGGAGSQIARFRGLVLHDGYLLTNEDFTGKIWRVDLNNFTISRFLGSSSADTGSPVSRHPDSVLDWHAWSDAVGLFRTNLFDDQRVFVTEGSSGIVGSIISTIDFDAERILAYAGVPSAYTDDYEDGFALAAEFSGVVDMTIDGLGHGFIADRVGRRIRRYLPAAPTRGVSDSLLQDRRIRTFR